MNGIPPGIRLFRVQHYRRSGPRATVAVWAEKPWQARIAVIDVCHRGIEGFESPIIATDDITDWPEARLYSSAENSWPIGGHRIAPPIPFAT